MRATRIPQTTDSRIVPKSRSYVVYDRNTGDILHVHHQVTFPNRAALREAPEIRARRLAGSKAGTNAEVLEVETAEVDHRRPIRIDPVKRIVTPRG
jgi:hypothetical protein